MKRRLLSFVTGIALTLGALTGCAAGTPAAAGSGQGTQASDKIYRTLDEIKESGTINIGVFSDKNPFGYVDENGAYQGYDVYFAERIGKDLGVKINYVSTEAASRVEYLETGKVDIVLANFTVTDERAEKVDFALPYMNVALGVVSHEDHVIESLDDIAEGEQVIVISGTTAETYLEKNNPEIKLQKFDTYATAKTSFENGTGVAWANDNTEVIAYSLENEGYVVGIPSLGSQDTIAPAVSKGNTTLLDWLNDEIKALGEENFFHADYEATLIDTYGKDYEETLVVEGGGDAAASTGSSSEAAATELDIRIAFINLSGGVGIDYTPEERANDIFAIGEGVRQVYDEILTAAGMGNVAIYTEMGRFMLGPFGSLVTRAIHKKHIYKEYIGVDACAANLMRPAMYGAYHHITVLGKENEPAAGKFDVVGSLCENNDKFAVDRELPAVENGDLLYIHDTGAHGHAMGYNYNGRLRSAELLLKEDGSVQEIRRAETLDDYFVTFDTTEYATALITE